MAVSESATVASPNGNRLGADLQVLHAYGAAMSDYSVARFPLPRDATGPVTCSVCGCRLVALTGAQDGAYRHFPSLMAGQDARGCRPYCVEAIHDHDGKVLIAAESARGSAANDAAAA